MPREISVKYWAFMKSGGLVNTRVVQPRSLQRTAKRDIVATLKVLLGPVQTILRARQADVASSTAGTHDGSLATIFLREVSCLKDRVAGHGLKLFELDPLDIGCDEREEEPRYWGI